jgi:arylsulfatase A-like enzyme
MKEGITVMNKRIKISRLHRQMALLVMCLVMSLSSTGKQPNIVVVLADDMGWSDLGCFGGEIPTPNIDHLAANGLRLTQVYNNAVCGPSRACLLTGLYAQRIGHTGIAWDQATDYSRCVTLGEVLQRAGYHTMVLGKWQDPDLPADRGFDRFFGFICEAKISYYEEVQKNLPHLDRERVKLPEDFYLTDALTEHALKFLDDRQRSDTAKRKPFFLYMAHIAPHWPLHAREADIAPHRQRYLEKGWDICRSERLAAQRKTALLPPEWKAAPRPESIAAWEKAPYKKWQAERMAVYAAQVASIDHSTGQILDAIRRSGELDNTLVVVMSDNGAAPDGGMMPSGSGFGFKPSTKPGWCLSGRVIRGGSGPDNMPGPPDTFAAYGPAWSMVSGTPFRSSKMTGYEGGIRTAMVACWPAGIKNPGRISHEACHFIDIMPTVIDLAGTTYPPEVSGDRQPLPLDGRSLVPIFKGEEPTARGTLYWRVPRHCVIRDDDWKLISVNGRDNWELYNIAKDGTETANLAKAHPELVRKMAADWKTWHQECGAK